MIDTITVENLHLGCQAKKQSRRVSDGGKRV
jgi:hypothetical protein